MTNYAGKCGTCVHFERDGERRAGWCHNYPYDESVVHDPKHPYLARAMSHKCRYYSDVRPTNADRIRSMSDEELAEFLTNINPTNCQDCAFSCGWRCQPDRDDYSDFEKCKEGRKRWLQQPPKGE